MKFHSRVAKFVATRFDILVGKMIGVSQAQLRFLRSCRDRSWGLFSCGYYDELTGADLLDIKHMIEQEIEYRRVAKR